ncbi:hypothetical protein PRVXH_001892 [Proteinivorax hydrogeniformans]|uniref:Type II secretion system protein n=1 Tax=Proteinivorax hydrogeniformans TaxID=1826727 RepID=A0AAU8HSI6_9FIRM
MNNNGAILLNVLLSVVLVSMVVATFTAAIITINQIEAYNRNYSDAVLVANNILEQKLSKNSKKHHYSFICAGDEMFDVEINVTQSSQFDVVDVTVSWRQLTGTYSVSLEGYYYEK